MNGSFENLQMEKQELLNSQQQQIAAMADENAQFNESIQRLNREKLLQFQEFQVSRLALIILFNLLIVYCFQRVVQEHEANVQNYKREVYLLHEQLHQSTSEQERAQSALRSEFEDIQRQLYTARQRIEELETEWKHSSNAANAYRGAFLFSYSFLWPHNFLA